MVALNHAVAAGMARGPEHGLRLTAELSTDDRVANDHRFHAVRAHLLEMAGDLGGARVAYEQAAARATSLAQQRYLRGRAGRIN
jgi:predicted RNA polymerase sigma factor